MTFMAFWTYCAQFNEIKELTYKGIPQQPLMALLIFLAFSTKAVLADQHFNLDSLCSRYLLGLLWQFLSLLVLHSKFNNVKEYNNLGNPLQPLMVFLAFVGHFSPFLQILIRLIYQLTYTIYISI